MIVLELEYQGDDLIISKETVEKKLGLQPGDRLEIRPKLALTPLERSLEEIAQIQKTLDALRQAFDPVDLENWDTSRKALWETWQPPAYRPPNPARVMPSTKRF